MLRLWCTRQSECCTVIDCAYGTECGIQPSLNVVVMFRTGSCRMASNYLKSVGLYKSQELAFVRINVCVVAELAHNTYDIISDHLYSYISGNENRQRALSGSDKIRLDSECIVNRQRLPLRAPQIVNFTGTGHLVVNHYLVVRLFGQPYQGCPKSLTTKQWLTTK